MYEDYSKEEFYNVFSSYVLNAMTSNEENFSKNLFNEIENSFNFKIIPFEVTYNGGNNTLCYDDKFKSLLESGYGDYLIEQGILLLESFYKMIGPESEEISGSRDFSNGSLYRVIATNNFHYGIFIENLIKIRESQKKYLLKSQESNSCAITKISFLDKNKNMVADFSLCEDNLFALPGRDIFLVSFWIKGFGRFCESLIIDKRKYMKESYFFRSWTSSKNKVSVELKKKNCYKGNFVAIENSLPETSLVKEIYTRINKDIYDTSEEGKGCLSSFKNDLFGSYIEVNKEYLEKCKKYEVNTDKNNFFKKNF